MLALGHKLRMGCLIGAVVFLTVATAHAEEGTVVARPLDKGTTATAWFRSGNREPAVVLLHGFLQTRDYLTVSALGASLAEQGFTVLSPTLSLGVDRRRSSLACEAAHVHTLDGDLAEIAGWIAWLEARGHHNIVLIGHSQGAMLALAYVVAKPSPAVRMMVGVGLIGAEDQNDLSAHRAQVALAARRQAEGDLGLRAYQLSYCRRFVASPASFVSYGRWDSERVLDAVAHSALPVRAILGEADNRLPRDWAARLGARGASVSVVEGAGHFFDGRHEFDLLDQVLGTLQAMQLAKP